MYSGPNPILLGLTKDKSDSIDHMVDDLEKQQAYFLIFT